MMRRLHVSAAVLLAAAMPVEPAAAAARAPLRVITTFAPTTDFARRIGGDLVEVSCPLPPDADPALWRPTRQQIAEFQGADLVVVNGAGYEGWLETVSLPRSRLVDTARGFRDQWLRHATAITHSHGPGGEHSHEGLDGHTWLDPVLAREQAEAIRDALAARLQGGRSAIDAGFAALAADLDDLDKRLRRLGRLADGEVLVAAHPAYAYLARRYGWRVVDVNLDPSEPPSAEALAGARAALAGARARFLLWTSPPRPAVAAACKEELGLESLLFSTCETEGAQRAAGAEDFAGAMCKNVERLSVAFPRAAPAGR